ncbi:MAG: hypothetical protein IJI11_00330 [Mogibacterium sp.]|nr:hypothetical protein [Mogibacterium sp.]
MGRPNKDIDIEIHGISPAQLHEILGMVGEPLAFGQSFGVFSLRGIDIDRAMPRREKASTALKTATITTHMLSTTASTGA